MYYQASRKFADLTKIRITAGAPQPGNGNCKVTLQGGYTLSMQFSATDIELFHVSNAGLDEALAAIMTLSPQVKLTQGVGF